MAGKVSRENGLKGGRPVGSLNQSTIDKIFERERLRQRIIPAMDRMTDAQIDHACGVSYMVLRNPDGTYTRATDVKQLDAALAIGDSAFRIFTQAPNTQAYADLMNRALDKPTEHHEHSGPDGGPVEVSWRRKSSK